MCDVLRATSDLATRYDWTVEQGEKIQLRIPVVDSLGAPYLVDGWFVDARVENVQGRNVIYTWPSEAWSASGTDVVLAILPVTSLGWIFSQGWYRVCITHPTDATQVYRILEGRFYVSED